MSGTINCKTGKDIFVKSIELLRTLKHKFVENLEFHICGQCDSSDFMERLSAEKIFPNVFYHGRLFCKKNIKICCSVATLVYH